MILSGDRAQSTNVISTVKARVNLSGSTNVRGVIDLTETSNRIGVHFVGKVTGLSPGKHGVHVHQFGDVISQGCDSTGAHYNPIGVRNINCISTTNFSYSSKALFTELIRKLWHDNSITYILLD